MVLCQKGEEQGRDNRTLFWYCILSYMEKRCRDGVMYDSVTPSSVLR